MEYKDWKTGEKVNITNMKEFKFPPTGAKVLVKARPPIAKESSTD